MQRWFDIGPGIGLRAERVLHGEQDVTGRKVHADGHLHGPVGYLQGGLVAGLLLGVARAADPIGAPPTAVDVTLRAPTPLGAELGAVTHHRGAGEHALELVDGDTTLAEGRVELQGHGLSARAYDLQALADVALPTPRPHALFDRCWVCGAGNPDGLTLLPGWHAPGQVVSGWIADPSLADGAGNLDPVVVCAVLDCPTLWATRDPQRVGDRQDVDEPAVLSGYHVRFYADAPVYEPLRTVARSDGPADGRWRARSALVDEDGVVYAVASATWTPVDELPER